MSIVQCRDPRCEEVYLPQGVWFSESESLPSTTLSIFALLLTRYLLGSLIDPGLAGYLLFGLERAVATGMYELVAEKACNRLAFLT